MFNKEDKKKDLKLSEDSARVQLDLLLDYYGVDSEDTSDGMDIVMKKLSRAIRDGSIEIKENENQVIVIQNLVSGQTLEYKGVGLAESKQGMKAMKIDDHYGRMHVLAGSMSGAGMDAIKKLAPKDLKISESLAAIFL